MLFVHFIKINFITGFYVNCDCTITSVGSVVTILDKIRHDKNSVEEWDNYKGAIPVISSTNTHGETRLLYIGLTDENGMQHTIPILKTVDIVNQIHHVVYYVIFEFQGKKYRSKIEYDKTFMYWQQTPFWNRLEEERFEQI